jgi:predicted RNase H-like HicB family nuclease
MAKRYTISDGKLVLTLEEAEEGGFVVSSPLDPGLWTQAETVAEAFENARDALKALAAARRKPIPLPAKRRSRRREHAA